MRKNGKGIKMRELAVVYLNFNFDHVLIEQGLNTK